MKKIIIISFLAIFLSGCSLPWKGKKTAVQSANTKEDVSSSTPFFYDISIAEAKEMIEAHNNLVVLNATSGNLDKMIFVNKNNLTDVVKDIDKNNFILVYTSSETIGTMMASRLTEQGFVHVYRLQEGNISWDQSALIWKVGL